LFVEHASSVRVIARAIPVVHGEYLLHTRTWMKNNFGFPAKLEHRSPVKGVHSISTGYRLSVECNRSDSPCDIAATTRQSASVWSSAAALMKGLINSSRWSLNGRRTRSGLIACAQTTLRRSEIVRILFAASRVFSGGFETLRNGCTCSFRVLRDAALRN